MSESRPEPPDLYLTRDECRAIVFQYLNRNEGAAERMAQHHFVEILCSLPRVTRDKYKGWHEAKARDKEQAEAESTPTGIPETIAAKLKARTLFMGPTQLDACRWAAGPRGPQATMRHLGMLIYGPTWGKTIAGCMTISPTHVQVGRGRRVFVSESALLKLILSKPTIATPDPTGPYRKAHRLVVDHMGALEPGKKATREMIEFLRERWERGRSNVLTTKLTLEQIKAHYGADAWATIERFCTMNEARKAQG